MAGRRDRGDGSVYWSASRNRWIAEVTIGYTPKGVRQYLRASGKTKTAAKEALKASLKKREEAPATSSPDFTVADAVNQWLKYDLTQQQQSTRDNYSTLAELHIISHLGARPLDELTADEIDEWMAERAPHLSTRTLRLILSLLNRSVARAAKRDKVKRNVVALCCAPAGIEGRMSKALNYTQAKAVLAAAVFSRLYAYIVVSLLTGARTEELRALDWDHVDLVGNPDVNPPIPPSIEVWHSVRGNGDTKTKKSRRTLALPILAVHAFKAQRQQQQRDRKAMGKKWHQTNLVFTGKTGLALDAANVRRGFRRVVALAGLDPTQWTPRELRHSFVSLLSDGGLRLEEIADLCGHAGPEITGKVYRHQIRPIMLHGAVVMDKIFDQLAHEATPGNA